MPRPVIGQIASDIQDKDLVLFLRKLRILGNEDQTQSEFKKKSSGPTDFANDLDCVLVK